MEGEWLKLSSPQDILDNLSKLDAQLLEPATIVLAGSAVPILAGCVFRATADIDFAIIPDRIVLRTVQADAQLSSIFDFKAAGVIGLLVDFDDRVVRVNGGFAKLQAYRLSLEDWVVSKLASPKLVDVLNIKEVTLDVLKWVQQMMPLYGGISDIQAASDLNWLMAHKESSGDAAVPRIKLF